MPFRSLDSRCFLASRYTALDSALSPRRGFPPSRIGLSRFVSDWCVILMLKAKPFR